MALPIYSTIEELRARIRSKKISPVEVVESHLRRAESLQPTLRAFANLDVEGALQQARDAENAVQRGIALGPLHGVPITIKCSMDLAGVPCPAGSLLRRKFVPREDAASVARLKKAGAIILGNTNTPEFLMAYESDNLLAGRTANPWNLAHTSGGSSGGESAAISSGCSVAGIGSDGGGSIRVPAHFTGICGLKPTPGRIPSTGHYPPGAGALSWLGVVGPLARTVADLRVMFEILAGPGPDPGDALSAPVPVHHVHDKALKNLRVGILESDALGSATPETVDTVKRGAKMLQALGFVVEPHRVSGLDRALDVWWFFFGPVVAHLFGPTIAGQEDSLSPIFREYLAAARPEQPLGLDDFISACTDRDLVRAQILPQLSDVDLLISPVSSEPAFPHGAGNYRLDAAHCYRNTMRFSQWPNLVGCPGISLPLGLSSEGLPIGLQLIGRPHQEELLLAVAERLEHARGPWQPPPI